MWCTQGAIGAAFFAALSLHPPAATAEAPTHAALELRPELFAALARGADYPCQLVDYDGGDARPALAPRGTWGGGEYGHLKRLNLFLDRPEDINIRFESEAVPPRRPRPIALLDLRLKGPAEAEWWQKLPLQGDWAKVTTFRRRIALTIRAKAEIRVEDKRTPNAYVALAFEDLTDRDVELNVRGCPPWLDGLLERQFQVREQVNVRLREQMADKTQIHLPPLTIPFTDKPVVYEDVRPQVHDGILRIEFVVGGH